MDGNLSQYILIDSINEQVSYDQMESSMNCALQTSDFLNLCTALSIGSPATLQNITFFNWAMWAWGNAHAHSVQVALDAVIATLKTGAVTVAGAEAAAIIRTINFSGDVMADYNASAIISWYNGLFLGLGLPYPDAAAACFQQYTSTQIALVTQFYNELWKTVAGTRPLEVYSVSTGYYNNEGKTIYSQIPATLWTCLDGTSDAANLKTKLAFGFDPYDPCYLQLVKAFIKSNFDNEYEYWAINSKVWNAELPDYFDAATLSYKELLLDISAIGTC
jgi:hypothetical protein